MRPALPFMVAAAQVEVARLKEVAPGSPGSIDQFLRGIGMILEVIARDWDSAAPDRVARIMALQALLVRGSTLAPPLLAATLSTAVRGVDLTLHLRLSELDAIYERLTVPMITLQAWLESVTDAAAVALAGDIDAHVLTVVEQQILTGSNPW